MYAITDRSSSSYQMAQVTNEVEVQARRLAVPQPSPSRYNQQASSAPATPAPQAVEPPASNFNIATSARQAAPVNRSDTDNSSRRESISRPQQDRVNQFNLEMVNEAPQNATSRNRIEHISQINNVDTAQKPANSNKFMESPYMIVVVNQSLTNMNQPKETSTTSQQSEKADEARQPTSIII